MRRVKIEGNLAEISRDIQNQISGDVIVEAGPELLVAMIGVGVIEKLQLSISPLNGDGNLIDTVKLLSNFTIESDKVLDGTRLLKCRYNGNAANS
jgi:riboflavin biosynthesis pyrimidine reductase